MSPIKSISFAIPIFLAVLLTACGGGGGGTGAAAPGGAAVVSSGVMMKGSVIVNGVEYDDSAAKISIDDSPNRPRAELQDGMVVKVRGRRNDDGVTGTADSVEVENEVRGQVGSTDDTVFPYLFTVINQSVRIDGQTVYANFVQTNPTPAQAIAQLGTGTVLVEVHGLRDQNGVIRASRVEILGGNPLDELRGRISALNAGADFTLTPGNVFVTYTPAMVFPAGALNIGDLVEVHGSFNAGTFAANKVDREDAEDSSYQPQSGDEIEYEGFVTNFSGNNGIGTFKVNGRDAVTNSSTRFEGGLANELIDNVRVEVEGHSLSAGALVVDKVKFKSAVRLFAVATFVDPTSRTLTVMGKTVQVDDFTVLSDPLGNINANTDRVEVRGHVVGSVIVAERLDVKNGGGDDFLQATVETKGATSLTLLGINANLSGGGVQYVDSRGTTDVPMSGRDAFLAAVSAQVIGPPARPGTLVKIKGTYSAGTLTATEADLEN